MSSVAVAACNIKQSSHHAKRQAMRMMLLTFCHLSIEGVIFSHDTAQGPGGRG